MKNWRIEADETIRRRKHTIIHIKWGGCIILPYDTESEDHLFYKTLNEDIQLKPDEYGRWDMQFENGDVVNIGGHESLINAVCIAIMTRYNELHHNELYVGFGCRIHELTKSNISEMTKRKMEYYTADILSKMRRVKRVNEITIDRTGYGYKIRFSITAVTDITVEGEVQL